MMEAVYLNGTGVVLWKYTQSVISAGYHDERCQSVN
jgi:hypothetical protein